MKCSPRRNCKLRLPESSSTQRALNEVQSPKELQEAALQAEIDATDPQ